MSGDKFGSLQKLATISEIERIGLAKGLLEIHATTEENLLPVSRELRNIFSKKLESGEIRRTPLSDRDRQLLERISSKKGDSTNSCMIDYGVNISLLDKGMR